MRNAVVGLQSVSKYFGTIHALVRVDLTLTAGEVLALVGDNGAGKSTLIRLLAGVYQPDEGSVIVNDAPVTLHSPDDAIGAGIATVFQDLALVEALDVAKNVFLGHEPTRLGWVRYRHMTQRSRRLFDSLKINLPAAMSSPVATLSGGQRQGVAIARGVLAGGAAVLMDEPTAALGVRETRRVGEIIDGLREQGKGVILVSHDLDFVFQLADRIQVMRLGKTAGVRDTAETSRAEIVHLITGTAGYA